MTNLDHITGAVPSKPVRARNRPSWRPNAKRTILLAAFNLLLMWSSVAVMLWKTYEHEIEGWKRIALTTSLTTAAYARQSLGSGDLVLRSMQDWLAERHIDSDEQFRRVVSDRAFYDALRDRILGARHLDVAAIADLNGNVIATTASFPAPALNIADREAFVAQMAPDAPAVALGGVVRTRTGQHRLAFFLSRRVTSTSGALLGVAIVGFDVEYFSDFFRQATVGGEDSISLFRTDGTLLATTFDNPSLLGQRFEHASPMQLVEHGRSGKVDLVGGPKWSDPSDERARLMAPTLVEGYPVFISISIGENVYLANWGEVALFLIGIALALTAITIYMAGRFLDLGERTERADRIAQERRLLATLVDTPSALCAVLDHDGRVLYSNEQFGNMLAKNADPTTVLTDPDLKGADTVLKFATEGTQDAIELDLRLERPGEPVRFMHFSVSRQHLPDLGSCTILVGHDETTRHQLQLAMAQSSKMLTLGELTTGMAHELSQPLNVIRMAAQNALTETAPPGSPGNDLAPADDDIPPLSDSEFRSFAAGKLTRIMSQVDRAADILSRMRIFGRAPTGPSKTFDARAAIRSALGLVGPRIRATGITIVDRLGGEELPLRGHQNLLEQVMVNLLMNARDAVSNQPQAEKVIEVTASAAAGNRVLLCVSDNGPGVPAGIRERIFEPFFTAKPLGQGTGLGLALSFGIIREAGGTLSLVPDSGRGATFQIDLPLAIPAETATATG